MYYQFKIRTGEFFRDETLLTRCISGNGEAVNNPAYQDVVGHGPLPAGIYKILKGVHHPRLGPMALQLMPDAGNEMFGRSDFFIHGLEIRTTMQNPGESSDGCICMEPESLRAEISLGVDENTTLEVVDL